MGAITSKKQEMRHLLAKVAAGLPYTQLQDSQEEIHTGTEDVRHRSQGKES